MRACITDLNVCPYVWMHDQYLAKDIQGILAACLEIPTKQNFPPQNITQAHLFSNKKNDAPCVPITLRDWILINTHDPSQPPRWASNG